MPENLDEIIDLKLDSLLEKLTPENVFTTLNQLAENSWKKGKTIEVINDNSTISDIFNAVKDTTIFSKFLGEPKKEEEMQTTASKWLRDVKGCTSVRNNISVAGKKADVVGGCSRLLGLTKEVYVIELKRTKAGIDRALGQITTYLEGAHYVYLAISPLTYYRMKKKEYNLSLIHI